VERDSGVGPAGYEVCILIQRDDEDNNIITSRFNLLVGQIDGKVVLLGKGLKNPLVKDISICIILDS
jgi:hypothetical protein